MRRILLLFAIGAALAGVGAAQAGDGAVHFVSCPTQSFVTTLGGFTVEMDVCFSDVTTPSGNANARFYGNLVDLGTAPAKATKVEGFFCEAGFPQEGFATRDTRVVITPNGTVNGSCKFHV
jgi:hypothetical protein